MERLILELEQLSETLHHAVEKLPSSSLIGVDGYLCSGKSTLAKILSQQFKLGCLSLDDFVLPLEEWPKDYQPEFPFRFMRSSEFYKSVQDLSSRGSCSYRPFDWVTRSVSPSAKTLELNEGVVVEGTGTLFPPFDELFALKIFVESDESTALQTAMERGDSSLREEWMNFILPSADIYMKSNPQGRSDIIVTGRTIFESEMESGRGK